MIAFEIQAPTSLSRLGRQSVAVQNISKKGSVLGAVKFDLLLKGLPAPSPPQIQRDPEVTGICCITPILSLWGKLSLRSRKGTCWVCADRFLQS